MKMVCSRQKREGKEVTLGSNAWEKHKESQVEGKRMGERGVSL